MRASPLFALACAAACIPEPAEVAGKLCSASSSCGAGYLCVAGRCAAEGDAGVPDGVDLMVNGGFEDASGPVWSASPGDDLAVQDGTAHSGARALRVGASGFDLFVASPSPPPVPSATAGVYCARAFVSGTGLAARLRVVEDPGVSEQYSEGAEATAGSAWQELRASREVAAGRAVSVALAVQGHASAASKVYLDDVQLWRSPTTACTPP